MSATCCCNEAVENAIVQAIQKFSGQTYFPPISKRSLRKNKIPRIICTDTLILSFSEELGFVEAVQECKTFENFYLKMTF